MSGVVETYGPKYSDGRRDKSDNKKSKVRSALCHAMTTFNNSIITFSDLKGDVMFAVSGGSVGFAGTRKSSIHAAQVVAERAASMAKKMGVVEVQIRLRGIGNAREYIIRSIAKSDMVITSLCLKTEPAHNGCTPPKRKRI